MEKVELRKMMESLHQELMGIQSVDEGGREFLRILMNDIQQILNESKEKEFKSSASFMGNLKDAVYYFEGSHPTLALSLSQMIDTLSNMGI